MSNWSDCSWVIDCMQAAVDKTNPSIRQLQFATGKTIKEKLDLLDPVTKSIKYSLVKPGGYTGYITLALSSELGCSVTYKFEVDGKTFKVDDVYTDFFHHRIPEFKKRFNSS